MSAFQNGRIPDASLVGITGKSGARLLSGAAAAWEALRAAVFRAHGWYPVPTGPSDAYRQYTVQETLFRTRYTPTYLAGRPIKVWNGVRWYLRPGQATAAVPGTSNHGQGIAVDVTGLGGFTSSRYKDFAGVAQPFGWSNVEGRSIGEPWHWVYTGSPELASTPGTGAGSVPTAPNVNTPTPISPEDELDANQNTYLIGAHDNAAEARRLSGESVEVLKKISDQLAEQTVLLRAINENSSESRRISSVLAGAVKPSGLEKTITQQIKGA